MIIDDKPFLTKPSVPVLEYKYCMFVFQWTVQIEGYSLYSLILSNYSCEIGYENFLLVWIKKKQNETLLAEASSKLKSSGYPQKKIAFILMLHI
jgi:hypothetical protein